MASIHKKMDKLGVDAFAASGKHSSISTRHYRLHSNCIQKKHHLYDNDWIDTHMFDDNDDGYFRSIETGTNRKAWKIHECDGFDDHKDCN